MKVLGIDIDGTLAPYRDYKNIAEPYPDAKKFLEQLKIEGYTVCIWTCRPDYQVRRWLILHGMMGIVDYINDSPLISDGRKKSFHHYIGDDAIEFKDGEYSDILTRLKSSTYSMENEEMDSEFSSEPPVMMYRGVGERYIEEFADLWQPLWEGRNNRFAFLTICSHAKPYSKSYIHSQIRKTLHKIGILKNLEYGHLSNAGIIPAVAENIYPFNSYDWDDSKNSDVGKSALQERLYQNIQEWHNRFSHNYEKIIIYLREGGKTTQSAKRMIDNCTDPGKYLFVTAKVQPDLPWALYQDPDNCLAATFNLKQLTLRIKELR
jgi:hypothetical protein